jgi:hypothetical protein
MTGLFPASFRGAGHPGSFADNGRMMAIKSARKRIRGNLTSGIT